MPAFHFVLDTGPLLQLWTARLDILLICSLHRSDTSETLQTIFADLLVLVLVVVD